LVSQELDGWYILCGEAVPTKETKCVKTQINQTLNLDEPKGDAGTPMSNSETKGRLSEWNITFFPMNWRSQSWSQSYNHELQRQRCKN
jgi:hypothetical protein